MLAVAKAQESLQAALAVAKAQESLQAALAVVEAVVVHTPSQDLRVYWAPPLLWHLKGLLWHLHPLLLAKHGEELEWHRHWAPQALLWAIQAPYHASHTLCWQRKLLLLEWCARGIHSGDTLQATPSILACRLRIGVQGT